MPCRRLLISWAVCLPAVLLPLAGRGDDAPRAGRRCALLVGVRKYDRDVFHGLRYTENDVNDLAAVLRDAGYTDVVLMTQAEGAAREGLEPTGKNVRKRLLELLKDRGPEDTVLVAFSGHGVQFRARPDSYFCPEDADLDDPKTLVSLADVYKGLQDCPATTKVLLVDACRNDPLARASKSAAREDLESVTRPQAERPPGGVAALFSCSEGQQSYESDKLEHGVFFHYVIQGLRGQASNKKGEVGLEHLAAYVADEVPDAVKDISPEARQCPQLVGDVSGPAPLVRTDAFRPGEAVENSIDMRLALIPAGTFFMGSPPDEDGHKDTETRHEVEITKAFYMGCCPVTRGQFRQFVKAAGYTTLAERTTLGGGAYNPRTGDWVYNPKYNWDHTAFPQEEDHPVVMVSWDDAVAFCHWLGKKEGRTYRLPTEAEWEYACRAGTTSRFWCGDRDEDLKGNANVADAALHKEGPGLDWCAAWNDGYAYTSPAGHYRANRWGLYDMNGNVWQWCADWYDKDYYRKSPRRDPTGPAEGTERVLRGGSWGNAPKLCRCAVRYGYNPSKDDTPADTGGFRVVREK